MPYGTVITAIIEDDIYTTETPSTYGISSFAIKIEPPPGTSYSDGTPVTFRIGDDAAVQTSTWQPGGNIELNLYDYRTPVPTVDIYVSDRNTAVSLSYNEGTYQAPKAAVATWVHPDWPSISEATWISSAYHVEDPRRISWRRFEKTFTIPAHATDISGVLTITADWAYTAYLNGTEIGSDRDASTVEIRTISPIPGTNTLTIRVAHLYVGSYPHSWETNPTGLIYKVTIDYDLLREPIPSPTPLPTPTASPTPSPTPEPTLIPTPVITPGPTPVVTPTPTAPPHPENSSSVNMGKIIGVALFSMVDLILIGLLIYLVWRFFLRPQEE